MISVIIPCFNTGLYLDEAIHSILNNRIKDFEIIIIDDGSTDLLTLNLLKEIRLSGIIKVITKKNGGPSSARNLGVAHSNGEFLLFLDSDNRIRPDYLSKALEHMNLGSKVGVVYSKPHFFGLESSVSPRFEVIDFKFDALLAGNYIDMCSLVRKEAFLDVGGFDENPELFYGEDGDLWVRIAQRGWKFYFIDEVLFDYRIRDNSLMGQVDDLKRTRTLHYFGSKHGYLIHQRYRQYFRVLESIQKKPLTYFLRILYYKFILKKPLIS
ncbi:MAG: glycosyltransferase [Algoriphagus sp.]|nr:glycosyltransferase [Algoriphagus sp.]